VSLPEFWPQADGSPLACREKLRVLADNHLELEQIMRDAFDDAVLMGVDEAAMRQILHAIVDQLQSPRRAVARQAVHS
jgi:metallophosphoesterase superfamily enzyme